MDVIEFDENYNGKLDNQVFTTIRPAEKKDLYETGKFYAIQQNYGDHAGRIVIQKAQVIDVRKYYQLSAIPRPILYTDTGLTGISLVEDLMESFGYDINEPFLVLTLFVHRR